jgi:hypothetical protein
MDLKGLLVLRVPLVLKVQQDLEVLQELQVLKVFKARQDPQVLLVLKVI